MLTKRISGYSSTLRKSPLRRWVSRCSVWVSRLAASIVASTCESSGRSPIVIWPSNLVKRPRTFVKMCFPMKSTVVWA